MTQASTSRQDRLYELMPAYYRERDLELGGPLRDLLRVIEEQVNVVEDDLWQLYENWFIETCQDWVVPYIGDLIGYRTAFAGESLARGRESLRNRILEPRRDVANTLRSRRRKGTLAILEELAADVAGWPARAVEFFPLLMLNQGVNHLHLERDGSTNLRHHLERGRSVDLRNSERLEQLGLPFDPFAHSVDVRRIASGTPGRYNIPNVGVFVWRLRSYPVTHTPALRLEKTAQHCYLFNALGINTPLFSKPEAETDPSHIAVEANVPMPIRRRALKRHPEAFFGPGKSLQIWVRRKDKKTQETWETISSEQLVVANLATWKYTVHGNKVLIDPELGRFAFPPMNRPDAVRVTYHHGFPADLGGGEYPRVVHPQHPLHDQAGEKTLYIRVSQEDTRFEDNPAPSDAKAQKAFHDELERLLKRWEELTETWRLQHQAWQREIKAGRGDPNQVPSVKVVDEPRTQDDLHKLEQALTDWAAQLEPYNLPHPPPPHLPPPHLRLTIPANSVHRALKHWSHLRETFPHAVIEIADSGVYAHPLHLHLNHCEHVQIRAAPHTRPILKLVDAKADEADGLIVSGHSEKPGGSIILDGLTITGQPVMIEGALCEVLIRHCTLVPGWGLTHDCEPEEPNAPSLILTNTTACIQIKHSIIGSIEVETDQVQHDPVRIHISDSILDATNNDLEVISANGCQTAHATLCLERVTVFGSIHTHAIQLAENTLFMGVVRVARSQIGCVRFSYIAPGSRTPSRYECQPKNPTDATQARPQFESTRYGQPNYARLSETCAKEIKRGADDESEMGAYHDLFEAQRTANLLARLKEFTPAGSEVGLIKAS